MDVGGTHDHVALAHLTRRLFVVRRLNGEQRDVRRGVVVGAGHQRDAERADFALEQARVHVVVVRRARLLDAELGLVEGDD